TTLTLIDSEGSSVSEDLSALVSDNQQITLEGNVLTIENGGSVDLEPLLKNTINTDLVLEGTTLTVFDSDGGFITEDLSSLISDNQQITLEGNVITIEDGGSIDLGPLLNNTTNSEFVLDGSILTLIDSDGESVSQDLSTLVSDNQQITLEGNTLILEDG